MKQRANPLYHREYRLENRDRIYKLCRDWRYRNPAQRLLSGAKGRAKTKGIEFTIDLSDVVLPTHCPYLGVELTNRPDMRSIGTNYSLDRKDPSKGYIKGNVQVISDLANRMKSNATPEHLRAFAESILRELSEVRNSK